MYLAIHKKKIPILPDVNIPIFLIFFRQTSMGSPSLCLAAAIGLLWLQGVRVRVRDVLGRITLEHMASWHPAWHPYSNPKEDLKKLETWKYMEIWANSMIKQPSIPSWKHVFGIFLGDYCNIFLSQGKESSPIITISEIVGIDVLSVLIQGDLAGSKLIAQILQRNWWRFGPTHGEQLGG